MIQHDRMKTLIFIQQFTNMRLFIFLFLLIFSLNFQAHVSSEDNLKPVVIPSFVIGQSMPFGHYATINGTSSGSSGFADPGLAYELGIMFMAGPTFGVTITFSRFSNPVNDDRLSNYLKSRFYTFNGEPINFNVDVGNWNNNTFLIGIAYKMAQKKVSFDLNLKLGVLSSATPKVRIDSVDANGNSYDWYKSNSDRNFGIAGSIGAQFRFLVVKSLYLNLNSSFLVSSFQLNNQVYHEHYDPYSQGFAGSGGNLNFGTFNLMLGFSYEFKLK